MDVAEHNKEEITRITVGGFKSINQEQSIEVKPLTILAGANSSGKSSIMQPLLLLKQTLEAPYNPGPLQLDGLNVKFTSAEQLLSRAYNGKTVDRFHVGITIADNSAIAVSFKRNPYEGIDLEKTTYSNAAKESLPVFIGMPKDKIQSFFAKTPLGRGLLLMAQHEGSQVNFTLVQDRFLLRLRANFDLKDGNDFSMLVPFIQSEQELVNSIQQVIHLPGFRGTPERDHPVNLVDRVLLGIFESYVASIIERWQINQDSERLERLNADLARLALTRKVVARRKNATTIELLVDRFLKGNKEDLVNIADVGLGVSQALPILVALHIITPGRLVYIEQPEIHLHPRAQSIMAEVLADAATQGKRLVVETHSSLLLRGIQTMVAEGKLSPELVKLHWFKQLEDGSTEIISADLDETGAYGDWPEDFDDVKLESESRYINAVEDKMLEGN